MKKLFFSLLLIVCISCIKRNCDDLFSDFESYEQITELIKKSSFRIKEQTDIIYKITTFALLKRNKNAYIAFY